jgi:hypothetical protein
MGTRSLTRIIPRQEGLAYDKAHERPELAIVNIYQQYDGYPEYMAVETYMAIYDTYNKEVIFVGMAWDALEKYNKEELV